MTTGADIIQRMKDENIKYLDVRFTDLRGKLQHVTMDASVVDADMFEDGVMFDGSSIAGWKAINESDMVLMPDPNSAYIDPFFAASTLAINCDILEPSTYQPYNRDPRSIAKKAEALVKSSGIGDSVVFGPEPEFFIFDDVKYSNTTYKVGFSVDHSELPTNNDAEYESGNNGHHIGLKKGYFPVPPLDSAQDMRGEMLEAMGQMGVIIEKHHHEVASAQHELGLKFKPMIQSADDVLIYKYVVQQVANAYGIATSRSGRTASRSSLVTSMPVCRSIASTTSAASSSTPRPSTHSPTRPPTPTNVWCRVSKRPCCWPTRPVTARLPAVSPSASRRSPSASRCVSPIRWRTPTSPSRPC